MDPIILSTDLFSEGLLEMSGEDSPGVSFDFEVGAGFRVVPEVRKSGFSVIEGGAEGGKGLGIEWDVEVYTAFGGAGVAIEVGEVSEAGERIGVEDDLVEVGRFVELTDRLEGFGVLGIEGEGVGEVDF